MKLLQWIHWRQVQLKILPLPSFAIICSPFPFLLFFLSPSLLSFTVRKDYLWRDNSVPSCTGKDGGPQTLLQWVTLTAGGNCKDKIWVLVFFDAAALSRAAHASAKCLWISGPRIWTYLFKISAISLVYAARAFPPHPLVLSCLLCASIMCVTWVHEPCVQRNNR